MPESQLTSTPPQVCRCEAAARWSVLAYEVSGVEATLEPFRGDLAPGGRGCNGWAVVIPSLGRVECVLDEGSDLGQASTKFHELSNAGWAVWALVPLTRLAGAHEAFQSAVDYVQGWWERKDEFSFTQPEIP